MPHTNIDQTQSTRFTTNAIRAMFFSGPPMTLLTGLLMIIAWPVLIFKGAMSGASISVTSDDFGVIVAGWTILVAIVSAVVRPLIKKRTGPRNMTPVIVGNTMLFAALRGAAK